MKKKWLALVLVVAMAMGLVACGSSSKDEKNDSAVENVQDTGAQDDAGNTVAGDATDVTTDATTDTATDDAADGDNADVTVNTDLPYWILQQDFGTPSTTFEGTLFNEALTIPLDISMLDSIATPYEWWPNGSGKTEVASINDILTSDILLAYDDSTNLGSTGNTTTIRTQSGEGVDVSMWTDEFCGLSKIYIYNFDPNGGELPVSTCYENGWWCVFEGENSNHAPILQIEGGSGVEMADQIIAKFGTPTYLGDIVGTYTSLEEWYASMAKDAVEMYSLFWEYDNFTLEIGLQEMSFGSEPSVDIMWVIYYTPEFWAVQKGISDELFPIG